MKNLIDKDVKPARAYLNWVACAPAGVGLIGLMFLGSLFTFANLSIPGMITLVACALFMAMSHAKLGPFENPTREKIKGRLRVILYAGFALASMASVPKIASVPFVSTESLLVIGGILLFFSTFGFVVEDWAAKRQNGAIASSEASA